MVGIYRLESDENLCFSSSVFSPCFFLQFGATVCQHCPVVLLWLSSLLAPCFAQPWGSFQGVQRRGLAGAKGEVPTGHTGGFWWLSQPSFACTRLALHRQSNTGSDTALLCPAAVFFSLLLTDRVSSSQRDEGTENTIRRRDVHRTFELVNVSSHTQKETHRFKHVN